MRRFVAVFLRLHAAETVQFAARIQAGEFRGFTAFGIRPDSLFARIGLKQQDVVVAVNGEIPSLADIYAAMQMGTVVEFKVQSSSGAERALVFKLVEN